MKNAVIRARIDSELKANALRVLAACGLESSDAIRLFLQQVVAHQEQEARAVTQARQVQRRAPGQHAHSHSTTGGRAVM